MKKVYICSPLEGDYNKNRRQALMYCRFAYEKGVLPFAPHVYFPEFLDDKNPKERCDGLNMGQQFMFMMDEQWVFGNDISSGMKEEIQRAKYLNKKIRYFNEDMEEI